ncbi:hypothetical protein THH46_12840 [Pseudomonas sp. NA13]
MQGAHHGDPAGECTDVGPGCRPRENALSDATSHPFWRRFDPVKEAYILFPLLAVLLLSVIWAGTLYLIKVEQARAQQGIAEASLEIGATYEAQILRAVREIDQTLKLVKYTYESGRETNPLPQLKARALLPSLICLTSAWSTPLAGSSPAPSRARPEAGLPRMSCKRWGVTLHCRSAVRGKARRRGVEVAFQPAARRGDGAFAGIAMVEVDAAYFVSSYDPSKLGDHGLLGLLGIDGIFRARRSGMRSRPATRSITPPWCRTLKTLKRYARSMDGTVCGATPTPVSSTIFRSRWSSVYPKKNSWPRWPGKRTPTSGVRQAPACC